MWNPNLYDNKHNFVTQYGASLIEMLNPQPGEHILDLGCGTGHHVAQIAARGALSLGVDSSPEMIAQAQQAYPSHSFRVADGASLPFTDTFDAVFSNAALHWMLDAERVVQSVFGALKPGGRFVLEMGGAGNIKHVRNAMTKAAQEAGHRAPIVFPWYFPSLGEYASLLESVGFAVEYAHLFDRPTPLSDKYAGIKHWLTMFTGTIFAEIPYTLHEQITTHVGEILRPEFFRGNQWYLDYRRLRVVAHKPEGREANIGASTPNEGALA